ncbi:AraC family transcriptional regulator [Paraburkholderia sp.]|uniref:AraC family transcriptional regulator n=1 Tax=Paraburkholderia sp. TaxID=1926495 RepID=UPI00239299FC|nr:AraC family transcriptional regulator [Paraburkholderia sp.]MDE1179903.1 AraC family transcriptional regulator [Paraburkholderia sp.]
MSTPSTSLATPRFWRDDALPFIEARAIDDGRKISYASHAHETFSIGAVTGGESVYVNGRVRQRVGRGAVVLMNPHDVHACNPLDDQPWSYRMFYLDTAWLTALQHELGFSRNQGFRAFSTAASRDAALFAQLDQLYDTLDDARIDTLYKHSAIVELFEHAHRLLNPAPTQPTEANYKLARAADFIRAHCTQPLKLDDICAAAGLSASYLIRAFNARYGMTPHAFVVNCRVEFSRAQLKRGRPIAAVAADAGFADQAHLQRAFLQRVAATPGQYRG